MSRLRSDETKRLARIVQTYAKHLSVSNKEKFIYDVANLIRSVQDETELALMRGEVRHLGEKHMLVTAIYCALSLCSRPVQREASFMIVKDALDKYLGIPMKPLTGKRIRRKLLTHV